VSECGITTEHPIHCIGSSSMRAYSARPAGRSSSTDSGSDERGHLARRSVTSHLVMHSRQYVCPSGVSTGSTKTSWQIEQ
jgi:hypothetical protein